MKRPRLASVRALPLILLLALAWWRATPAGPRDLGQGAASTISLAITGDQALVQIDGERFLSDRSSARKLSLPPEDEEVFAFAVFGDRTGGPAEGVAVLAQAVAETNLLQPELVMTVGDLIEGYNTEQPWLVQMREYHTIMDRLHCPWFPVAGNHDVYWRGEGSRPAGENEALYEEHFGPLWYAFRHKNAWFIALYSDEGDASNGDKDFNQPRCQTMSPRQFAWLERVLQTARGADHVFVFLHHPRWLKNNYGEDWDKVHALLARAGNVTAVFAGHIHHMRYDGVRDGIEYFTLATVGGAQSGYAPAAGWLHQYTFVSVRKDSIATIAYPVGSAMDPRAITGQVSDESARLARELTPRFSAPPRLTAEGALEGELAFTLANPVDRPIELEYWLEGAATGWDFALERAHIVLSPKSTHGVKLPVRRSAHAFDASFRLPELVLAAHWLGENLRVPIPEKRFRIPLDLSAVPESSTGEWALALDGVDDALAIDSTLLNVPDGPFTVEGWLQAEAWSERAGFINKTENGEFGLFVSQGQPLFTVHLNGSYQDLAYSGIPLALEQWTHLAGVFDGEELRLYVQGELVASRTASGTRTALSLPVMLGADVGPRGLPNSHFSGQIDEIRFSKGARYQGERFEPGRRFSTDEETLCLLHFDGLAGDMAIDSSHAGAHARLLGQPRLVPLEPR